LQNRSERIYLGAGRANALTLSAKKRLQALRAGLFFLALDQSYGSSLPPPFRRVMARMAERWRRLRRGASEVPASAAAPPANPASQARVPGSAAAPPPQPRSPRPVHEGLLVVQHLAKSYRQRRVVEDVSLYIRRSEAVGLLGPNGAGKTTVFYMITGLVRPDQGVIELDGYNVTPLPMYRRARLGIGYLPQEASIFRGLTVEQNIRAILEVAEPEPDAREAMLDGLLAEFSISHLRRAPAMALSGGERRRCEIARALAMQPNFILLDEPLAGIDPIAVNDIRALVAHLKDRGIGVLITDHNVRDTLKIVDRAYILHEGRVLMEGAPDEIVADADVRRVYLGERFSL
jgi:lipopolysaccharide export system ATP-binding protein